MMRFLLYWTVAFVPLTFIVLMTTALFAVHQFTFSFLLGFMPNVVMAASWCSLIVCAQKYLNQWRENKKR
ncbi:MAG: hypothetical protein V4463_01480 [Pseudomonadota bacterium]